MGLSQHGVREERGEDERLEECVVCVQHLTLGSEGIASTTSTQLESPGHHP